MPQVRWKENQLATYVYFPAPHGVSRVREKREKHFEGKGGVLFYSLFFFFK